MPIVWNLKKWLAVHRDIYRPTELQALLEERAGVVLSHQAVSALINRTPSALRMQTIQALCTALDCKLSDFCEVLPDTERERHRKVAGQPRRLYGKPSGNVQTESGIAFPAPSDYYDAAGGTRGDNKVR